MTLTRRTFIGLIAACAAALISSRPGAQTEPAPIVVLISFDGWRWDYFDRIEPPNLQALAAAGVRSEGLIPSFPASTFPNHYTIVTGLRPERHGIISNSMRDPALPDRFSQSAATMTDARWWGGEPIWVTAIRQGRRAATMFWPGSEAAITGVRPTYWEPFDDAKPTGARVAQVLEWLALPEARRPSLITLYFSDVDHAGHDSGPDSPEAFEAARRLDAALGTLRSGVETLGLANRVHFVVVSDHGMASLDRERVILLDDYLDLSTVEVVDWSPLVQAWPRRGTFEDVYQALHGKHPALKVYRKAEIPAHLHFREHVRIPDVIGIADEGWLVTSRIRLLGWRIAGFPRGGHGFDPANRSMHGLFVAAGPRIPRGVVVAPFENVHLYQWLCGLLGLTPAPNDGDPAATRSLRIERQPVGHL